MRDSFPFTIKWQEPKLRQESESWMQNVPQRFDNKKNERQNLKLNYGSKYKSNASVYTDSYQKLEK